MYDAKECLLLGDEIDEVFSDLFSIRKSFKIFRKFPMNKKPSKHGFLFEYVLDNTWTLQEILTAYDDACKPRTKVGVFLWDWNYKQGRIALRQGLIRQWETIYWIYEK